jgi:hypothetical protein
VVKLARNGRLVFAALVIVVLAGLYAVAGPHRPSAAGYAAVADGRAPVTTAVQACAAPGSAGVTAGSLAMTAVPDSSGPGSAEVTRLVPGGSPASGASLTHDTTAGLLQLLAVRAAPQLSKSMLVGQPGSTSDVSTVTGRGGVAVAATGSMAQGLAVDQVGSAGRITAECGSPGTSFWFAGPGQTSAGTLELYLMNTDDVTADAQVTAVTDITKSGPILANADNGIAVPPHSMVVQSLTGLLQSSKVLALNVSTSVGRIVASLRETKRSSDAGSWLPAGQQPGRHLVIPGLPSSGRTPVLYIAVPGSASSQVRVTAVTAKGSYQPTGGTGIDLLGQTATAIPLPALAGVGGSVSITASTPVTASMLVSGGPAGTPGVLAASTAPVQEQAVIADSPASSAGKADLVLSAPGHAASVRVTVGTSTTSVAGQAGTVEQISAGSSIVVPIRAPAGHHSSSIKSLVVVVSPLAGSGPVYGAWSVSAGGTLQSILPLISAPTWIPLPAVHEGLTAAAP